MSRIHRNGIWKVLFFVYFLALFLIVVLKVQHPNFMYGWQRFWNGDPFTPRYSLTLFHTIKSYLHNYDYQVHQYNLWGNILPFIPLGFLLPAAFAKLRPLYVAIPLCLLLIVGLETLQLYTGLGSFDVDDIFLNGISVLLGYTAFVLFRRKPLKFQV